MSLAPHTKSPRSKSNDVSQLTIASGSSALQISFDNGRLIVDGVLLKVFGKGGNLKFKGTGHVLVIVKDQFSHLVFISTYGAFRSVW